MTSATDVQALLTPPPERRGWPWQLPPVELPDSPDGGWPRLSIVVPSFQQGEYLEETLRSILGQGYPNLELLVLDGGSTDGTVEVLRRYEPWLDHWVSEPDGGQSDAINKGFARATGDLITFTGSDDLYLPGTFVELAESWARAPHHGAVVGAFRTLDEASRLGSEVIPARIPEPQPVDLTLADPAAWRLHQAATFYSREALDAVGRRVRPELRYTMDRELLYRVCRSYPVRVSKSAWGAFRRHGTSKSGDPRQALAFCREMSSLHRLLAPAEESSANRRRRRRWQRYWLARGHWKAARSGPRPARLLALLRTPLYYPSLALRRQYLGDWLRALGLRPDSRQAAPV